MAQLPVLASNARNLPVLVDSRGRPMVRELLDKEIAGPMMSGVRSIIGGHPWQNLDPQRLTALLRDAEQGNPIAYLELAEELEEKDPHYNSVLGTRKRAIAQMPMSVEPFDDSAEAKADAAIVEAWTERDTLETEIFDILDAIGKGYSFTEIVWDTKSPLWLPSRLIWRDPRFFEFDRDDGETPLLRTEGGQTVALEPAKFIAHVHPAKSGIPARGGIARIAAWGAMFKNYALKDWVSFLELYGVPMRVGRFDAGAHEEDIRKLMRAVSQVGTDAAAVFPRTMDIEFIDGKAGTSPNDLWRSLAGYVDDQMSKLVLGQTSSSDAKAGGLGSGQADLHGEVRDDIARADAKLLAATLNRDLVRPMIQLNRGMRSGYPRIVIAKPDPVDVKATMEAAKTFVDMGGKLAQDDMREIAGLPAPKAGETELLISPGQKAAENAQAGLDGPAAAGKGAPALLAPLRGVKSAVKTPSNDDEAAVADAAGENRDPDAISIATDESLSDWDEMLDTLVDSVADDIAMASSDEEAREIFAKAVTTMDVGDFLELLARGGFAARLAGEVDLQAEQEAD